MGRTFCLAQASPLPLSPVPIFAQETGSWDLLRTTRLVGAGPKVLPGSMPQTRAELGYDGAPTVTFWTPQRLP